MFLQVACHAERFSSKTMIYGGCELFLVVVLLILAPRFFSVSFLLGDALVFRLKRLQLSCLFVAWFVLKHSSHSSYDSGLLGIRLLLVFLCLITVVEFLLLLHNPSLLLRSLECEAVVIKQVLTLELEAAGRVGRHILLWAVKSLSRSFHFLVKI